jgi:molybdopterin-guanine dinucleotide biosynthesis protein A
MITENIDAYVLAGGKSRRMGFDKLILQIDGQSLLERTVAVCKHCFRQVKLVAGKSAGLSLPGHEVVPDSPRAEGPMAGVIASLEDCREDCCFITAADLIDLNADMIESLVSRYSGQHYLGFAEAGGLQPLCGIYHKLSLERFYKSARDGEFSVSRVVERINHDSIFVPSTRWRNINCPEDLAIGERND